VRESALKYNHGWHKFASGRTTKVSRYMVSCQHSLAEDMAFLQAIDALVSLLFVTPASLVTIEDLFQQQTT
jgi:hypothetical protein